MKELRQHRVRWRPVPTDSHDVPPTIRHRLCVPWRKRRAPRPSKSRWHKPQRMRARISVDDCQHVSNARAARQDWAWIHRREEDGVEGPEHRPLCDRSRCHGWCCDSSSVPIGQETKLMRIAENIEEEAALGHLRMRHDISNWHA